MDITEAADLARRVRHLYHQIEEAKEGSPWGVKDDMLGLVNDVGTLSRLVMATEGRWAPGGDLDAQLKGKLAECLWWVLVLADRGRRRRDPPAGAVRPPAAPAASRRSCSRAGGRRHRGPGYGGGDGQLVRRADIERLVGGLLPLNGRCR